MIIEKELSDISWQVPEETYRMDPALSYSTLAKYEREGFDKLDSLFEHITTPSLTLGSMVDCLITGSLEEFDAQFYVADFPAIGDKELQVVTQLFDLYGNYYAELEAMPATYILDVANTVEFQKNWRDDTRVKVLTERCSQYYKVKKLAGNRTVVDMNTFEDVKAMVRALKTSPATCGYFQDNEEDSPIRRYYQLKFKATFGGINYRCMMDECCVNYETKEIIPIDLKTSYKKEWNFEKSFMEWRYPIQAMLYAAILKDNLSRDPYFKDFTIKNYRFIVVNRQSLTPLVWEFPHTFCTEDLVTEEGEVFRHPFTIGKELSYYLNNKPNVPVGINLTGLNTIKCLKVSEK